MTSRLLLAAACFSGFFSWGCQAASLTITAGNLRSDQGQVLLCIFSAESSDRAGFPDCAKGRPVRSANVVIGVCKAVITFDGLKDGVYAAAIIHDENGNGQLDTNLIGIPTEGVGVSTNPFLLGKPHFDEGQFSIKGDTATTINAKYIL